MISPRFSRRFAVTGAVSAVTLGALLHNLEGGTAEAAPADIDYGELYLRFIRNGAPSTIAVPRAVKLRTIKSAVLEIEFSFDDRISGATSEVNVYVGQDMFVFAQSGNKLKRPNERYVRYRGKASPGAPVVSTPVRDSLAASPAVLESSPIASRVRVRLASGGWQGWTTISKPDLGKTQALSVLTTWAAVGDNSARYLVPQVAAVFSSQAQSSGAVHIFGSSDSRAVSKLSVIRIEMDGTNLPYSSVAGFSGVGRHDLSITYRIDEAIPANSSIRAYFEFTVGGTPPTRPGSSWVAASSTDSLQGASLSSPNFSTPVTHGMNSYKNASLIGG